MKTIKHPIIAIFIVGIMIMEQERLFSSITNQIILLTQVPTQNTIDLSYPLLGENSSTYLGVPHMKNDDSLHLIMIKRPYYMLAYHKQRRYPLWVAWHLDSSNLGASNRNNRFYTDTLLPNDIYSVRSQDYTHSGFDRGHNCPSADRTNSKAANQSTFMMTNITPQVAFINRGIWKDLETYTRHKVRQGLEAYVLCGAFGKGGIRAVYDTVYYIGQGVDHWIEVPRYFWKSIIFLKEGDKDRERAINPQLAISVLIPNDATLSKNKKWQDFKVSLDSVSKVTQLSLFEDIIKRDF